MKCCSCDNILSDFEATRRGALSGDYLNLCNKCISGLGIQTIDRADLARSSSPIYEDPDYVDFGFLTPPDNSGWFLEDES